MLSRHFLRSKVMQAIYANWINERTTSESLQLFDYHISRLNELGVLQLALLPKMIEVAKQVMDDGERKFLPTDSERNPNRRFLNNRFILRMADNFELKKVIQSWGGCWEVNEDLVREAFVDFSKQQSYADYINSEDDGFEQDHELVVQLFRYLMNRPTLVDAMAERSLLWEDDFEQIAQYNFMMLKALNEEDFDEASPWAMMYDKRVEKEVDDFSFARQLLNDVLDSREDNKALIKRFLKDWEYDRVAMVDIILLNMAISELTGCPTIPERVTLDEYVEMSKEFSADRSKLFINGILVKLISELRSQGRVNKIGRGLGE